MDSEPQELRLSVARRTRSGRVEAVTRARKFVEQAAAETRTRFDHSDAPAEIRDEAFAELPENAAMPEPTSASDGIDGSLMQELTDQLRQLDAQREQLSALLQRAQQ